MIQLPNKPIGQKVIDETVGNEMPSSPKYFSPNGAAQSASLNTITVITAAASIPSQKLPVTY